MQVYELVCGIILLVAATFLIFAVLMQSGKSKKLSGTIAGGAETFFGKTKGKAWDKILSRLTTIIAVLFVLLVVVLYVIQPKTEANKDEAGWDDTPETTETTEK